YPKLFDFLAFLELGPLAWPAFIRSAHYVITHHWFALRTALRSRMTRSHLPCRRLITRRVPITLFASFSGYRNSLMVRRRETCTPARLATLPHGETAVSLPRSPSPASLPTRRNSQCPVQTAKYWNGGGSSGLGACMITARTWSFGMSRLYP